MGQGLPSFGFQRVGPGQEKGILQGFLIHLQGQVLVEQNLLPFFLFLVHGVFGQFLDPGQGLCIFFQGKENIDQGFLPFQGDLFWVVGQKPIEYSKGLGIVFGGSMADSCIIQILRFFSKLVSYSLAKAAAALAISASS